MKRFQTAILPASAGLMLLISCGGGDYKAPQSPAESSSSVFFIGSDKDKLSLRSNNIDVRDMDNKNIPESRHIVIVDGRYASSQGAFHREAVREMIKASASAGNPVIAWGDASIVRGLIPEMEDAEDTKTTKDAVSQTFEVYGYLHTGEYTREFGTGDTDIVEITRSACKWGNEALDELSNVGHADANKATALAAATPSWPFLPTAARGWTSGSRWGHGQVTIRTEFFKLQNDGVANYDYWMVRVKHEVRPYYPYKSRRAWQQISMYGTDITLLDYDPPTTQGVSTATVDIGISAGGGISGGVSASWSYSASDVMIANGCSFTWPMADWVHYINPNSLSGQSTYLATPGCVVRVPKAITKPYREWFEAYNTNFYKDGVTDDPGYRVVWKKGLAGPTTVSP